MGKDSIVEEQLGSLIKPCVQSLGYQLWGIEYLPSGKGGILRVFIDSIEGISVDDCAIVSNQVSGLLDVEDPIYGEYQLEVSSPGIDRILFYKEQYFDFIGEQLDLLLRIPIEGRRRFKGFLREVLSSEVILQVDGHDYRLPFDNLERARVQQTTGDLK